MTMTPADNRRRLERLRAGDEEYQRELTKRNADRRAQLLARERDLAQDLNLYGDLRPKGGKPRRRRKAKPKGPSAGDRFIREYQAEREAAEA